MPEFDLSSLTPVLDELAPQGRTALLPALHAAQGQFGYLPRQVIDEISRRLNVPLSDVESVIDFYPLFYRQPVAKTVIHVCSDPACAMAGSDGVMKMLSQSMETHRQQGEMVNTLTIERSPCLGLCEHAPALEVRGAGVSHAETATYEDLVAGNLRHPRSLVRRDVTILTPNCGKGYVTWLTQYQISGGYQALRKALQMTPLAVLNEVKASGLVGRGGAAFLTGQKWESAVQAGNLPHYVVCNADEAEPGSFKDRVLVEDDPHRVLEGLILAGYAIGANRGYIYVRGEYAFQYQTILHAAEEARGAGYLGENILGSGFTFEVEVRRGAGAYVCGEETALLESIEGKPGLPRVRPPFPAVRGLFGQPTVVNNVETLANIPYILKYGAAAYRKVGTPQSPGSKLFCLSGDVALPGLYEVPFGITFGRLLNDLAGGVRGKRQFKAALFGGAAGAFATQFHLDVPLTFEDLQAAGLPLGAGVITVFDTTRDLRDICLRLAQFFAAESCGKCSACQTGAQRQVEILQRLVQGQPEAGDLERLQDAAWNHPTASICGVGQNAASAIRSALTYWPDLFEAA